MALYILSIMVAAFLWSKLKIEIEGANGWAASLPTWRIEKHVLLEVLYGGRPFTG